MSEEQGIYISSDKIIGEREHFVNVSSNFITISEDKAKLCLRDYIENHKQRISWITPLSLFLTILLTLLTTDFKDSFGLTNVHWESIFIILGFITLGQLIFSLFKRRKYMTIDNLVDIMKKEER